jgi:RNA-directed DNA polymerase
MHENRETSAVPEVVAGRSAQAQGRTPDMHTAEESDFGVVPGKQPNKEAFISAEAVEGRPKTKENIAPSDTCPTQSGRSVPQGLRGVRERARKEKKEKFTALLHHLAIDLLREGYFALQRRAAPGIDGETWQQYGDGLEDRLIDLHSRVHRGAYRAKPSRRVYIPKADGRQRSLGIAALEDKIVQQAVVTILNQIYEVDFKGFSYGFRPGRSPHHGLDALYVGLVRSKVNWVLDADIRSFFDRMSHEWMMQLLQRRVARQPHSAPDPEMAEGRSDGRRPTGGDGNRNAARSRGHAPYTKGNFRYLKSPILHLEMRPRESECCDES